MHNNTVAVCSMRSQAMLSLYIECHFCNSMSTSAAANLCDECRVRLQVKDSKVAMPIAEGKRSQGGGNVVTTVHTNLTGDC